MSHGREAFRLSYDISPITLVGGIAGVGGVLPIVSILQPGAFSDGLLQPANQNISLDDFVAHFVVMPGGTLGEYTVGKYPFANQYVAANAVIFQPIHVSLRMIAPAQTNGGYPSKLPLFSALKATIDQHMAIGGVFTVATPAFTYTNGILTPALRDVTGSGGGSQVQVEWEWPFEFPLITSAQAQTAQNSLMAKTTAGVKIQGDPPTSTGPLNSGSDPDSGQGGLDIPPANNQQGANSGIGG
jgi:hypothetical protein